jgi:hypothetical protein
VADPTINCVWTTGAIVTRVSPLDGVYDEELVVSANAVRLGRLNAGAPVLNSHQHHDVRHVIGAVVPGSARIEAGQGLARLRLSRAPGDADIVTKIHDGIVKGVSIGYARNRVEEIERPRPQWPLRRVVDWEPYEITICAIGADIGAMLLASGDATAARIRMEMAARRLSMTPADVARESRLRMEAREMHLSMPGRIVRLSDDQAARRSATSWCAV